jgi:hypothetical protein
MVAPSVQSQTAIPRGRLIVGGTIFVAGFLAPLLIPLVAASSLPSGWKAAISGLLALGIPELGMLVAVAVMGKPGFEFLKTRIGRFFRQHGPPATVSRTRYSVGLVMFTVPLLVAWVTPYAPYLLHGLDLNRVSIAVAGDLTWMASLFVLGGDFWDKMRSLFVHGARAEFPAR